MVVCSLYEKIAFFRDQANSTESGRTSKFFPKRHEITSNFLKKASGKCHYKQEYRWAKAFEKKKLETSGLYKNIIIIEKKSQHVYFF
jgi:hypothetical protein